jgi:alpha-tubulin suppressor-like RCC1 family protein
MKQKLQKSRLFSRANRQMAMFAGFRFRFSVNAFHVLSSTIAVLVSAIMLGAAGPAAAAPEALVQQIAIGGDHGCALTLSGGVKCWGGNLNGQLGDGTVTDRMAPVDVTDMSSGVTAIAAGLERTCALIVGGAVKCWGHNGTGGLDTTPVEVSGLSSGVVTVAVGSNHTCVLTGTGGVKCWGFNGNGQLGDGTTTAGFTPVDVSGLSTGVTAIVAGGSHTCALTDTGGVKCWGYKADGTTTDITTPVNILGLSSGVTAIVAGYSHTCALISTGGVKCWGFNFDAQLGDGTTTDRTTPVDVLGLSNGATAINAGGNHTCALVGTSGVRCWGANDFGQLGDNTVSSHLTPVEVSGLNSGITAIAPGSGHTCTLTDAGGVKCWGTNSVGQLGDGTMSDRTSPADVLGLTGAIRGIVAGAGHTCAVIGIGISLKCWGSNQLGQLGDGTTTNRLTPVDVSGLSSTGIAFAAGHDHTCALAGTGSVKCWGSNQVGQLGDGATTDRSTPVDVLGLSGANTAIVAGIGHTCVLTAAGGVKCWGNNQTGQLGNSTTIDSTVPVDVTDLPSDVTAIAAGSNHTCALTGKGIVMCWGRNEAGQLGDGTVTDSTTPVEVSSLGSGIATIATGGNHTCAINEKGGAFCWGSNDAGQLGDGTTIERATPVNVTGLDSQVTVIAAGGSHTCALISNGAVSCWGKNTTGQVGDGTAIDRTVPVAVAGLSSGVIALGAGFSHTCALTGTRGVACWGRNDAGQLGDGSVTDRTLPLNIARVDQSITFNPAANQLPHAGSVTISATATSGLPVDFDSLTPPICTVSDTGLVMAFGAIGESCSIRAQQPGNESYFEALPQVRTFEITRGIQTINFNALPDRRIGDGAFTVNASGGGSGLPVIFASQTPAVCTVGGSNGATVALRGLGTCHLRASQAGDKNFSEAADVDQRFTVITRADDDESSVKWWRWRGGSGGCTVLPHAGFDWSFAILLLLGLGLRMQRRHR